jgi:hypothetical protein
VTIHSTNGEHAKSKKILMLLGNYAENENTMGRFQALIRVGQPVDRSNYDPKDDPLDCYLKLNLLRCLRWRTDQ